MPEWKDEDLGRSAPFYFSMIMKKLFTLIILSIISFNAIHAEITWNLSDDGTLTISGTNMPDYNIGKSNRAPWYSNQGKIMKVVIEDGVTNIGQYAFDSHNSLTSVSIPNSLTHIGNCAFKGCAKLSSVTIGNSVTYIGDKAFYECYGLTSITFPNSLTYIGNEAFSFCSKITTITIPNSVTYIGTSAFSGTKWFENQPEGLIYLGSFLYRCKNPTYQAVEIKEGTKGIVGMAFQGLQTLKSVTIPNSVMYIGDYAFYGCLKLTNANIPNSVTSIGNFAFSGCSRLVGSITIPNSVTSIGEGVFSGCSGLVGSLIIPNSVTCIGDKAFYGCSGFTSVTIGNSVTSIGLSAFDGCSSLLGSIIIPNSVTSIGNSAFNGCLGLSSLTIGNSVMSIGAEAFIGCSSIKEIYSWNVVPPVCGDGVFGEMNTLHAKVFVPEGSGNDYNFAKGWMNFLNVHEMEYTPVLSAVDPISISDSKPSVTKGYYKEKTVTYVREGATISKENYASFCLPFAVDPTDVQFKAVYVPVGLSLYNTETNTLRIGFYQTDDIIPAGTPFLAQLAVDNKVEINNALPVNYDPNTPTIKTSVVRTFNYSNEAGIMNENNDYAINISGSYQKISPTNCYTFNTDGSIGASANVVPFRAYFIIDKNASNAKIITSFDIESETTGIKNLQITNHESPVYDMNGRRVNEKSLKFGIYIKNGKKYVK